MQADQSTGKQETQNLQTVMQKADSLASLSTNSLNSYTLSIDIGIHNLGYAIGLQNSAAILHKQRNEVEAATIATTLYSFGLFDIDDKIKKSANIVMERVRLVSMFLKQIFKNLPITIVIIERQVNTNVMAMELMYCVASCCYQYCRNIIIFDPKLKFTKLKIPYETKNKAHKKLSIKIIRNYISNYYEDLLERFVSYDKLDDISDAVFMLLVYSYNDNPAELKKLRKCIDA